MQPALQNPSLQLSSSAQPCGAAAGSACASPSALPRTGRQLTLTLDPPRPDLRISSPVPALRRCFRIGLRLLIRPASNRSLTFVSSRFIRLKPATSRRPLLLSCRPALFSAQALRPARRPWLSGFTFGKVSRPFLRLRLPAGLPLRLAPFASAQLSSRLQPGICRSARASRLLPRLQPASGRPSLASGLAPLRPLPTLWQLLRTGYRPTACAACLLPVLPDRLAPILRQPAFPLASIRPACASRPVPTLQP